MRIFYKKNTREIFYITDNKKLVTSLDSNIYEDKEKMAKDWLKEHKINDPMQFPEKTYFLDEDFNITNKLNNTENL